MLIDFRQLFPKYNLKFNGVLHVGANVGEEAPVYSELGISKQMWIEANPDIYQKLKRNIANNPNARAYNFAAGEETRIATLHISNNGSQSSSVLELGTHAIVHPDVHYVADVEVPMYPIERFFDDLAVLDDERDSLNGCDFLNCDVQGLELSVLRGLGRYLKQFKAVYLEVNKQELYKGCALIDSIDLFMTANRFSRVETLWCGNTGWGDALYIKDK